MHIGLLLKLQHLCFLAGMIKFASSREKLLANKHMSSTAATFTAPQIELNESQN